ncbi:MAG: hypothetical protein H0V27_15210 [Pyrinomonadaceae bacterium]|nr:hypothetical protein [Pyrinomonadaceae bacterium]
MNNNRTFGRAGEDFIPFSNIADDVWHNDKEIGAYEWWYFDAASDDGRDVLVVIFLTNFIFSPRYNQAVSNAQSKDNSSAPPQFPAVSVWWYRNGKVRLRLVNEYASELFAASTSSPECRIGASGFHLERQNGEVRYCVQLDETMRRGRKLQASLEWCVVEGDLAPRPRESHRSASPPAHEWNLVAPRCHVNGTLNVLDSNSSNRAHRFSGTGYHDHNRDRRPMAQTISEWQWGRAHFRERTMIFYRYAGRDLERSSAARLFVVHRNKLVTHDARFIHEDVRRDLFGLRYPRALRIEFQDESGAPAVLHVAQRHLLESSFFYLRFLGEARLETSGANGEQASIISEYLAPRALQWRWLHWLINMRIGRENRSSFLP